VIEQYKGKPYYLHFVRQGETLTAISLAYNVSIEEILAENSVQEGLKADQVIRIPKKDDLFKTTEEKRITEEKTGKNLEPVQGKSYIVKKKETLYGISRQHGITVDDLIKANPHVSILQEGMEIIIPDPGKFEKQVGSEPTSQIPVDADQSYSEIVIRQGQTIYSLCKEYGISADEFIRLNPDAAGGLKTDQVVKVPANKASGKDTNANQVIGHENTHIEKPSSTIRSTAASSLFRANDSCYRAENKTRKYQVAILLPLALEETDSILAQSEDSRKSVNDYKAFDFFQFYVGLKMAADSLEKFGFRAEFHILDADQEGDTLKIKKVLRKNDLSDMDLVIGPVFMKSFDIVSRISLKQHVNLVNPLSRRERIIEGNPYVYKVQASDRDVAATLASHIRNTFPGANIVLIRSDDSENSSMREVFKNEIDQGYGTGKVTLKEVNYSKTAFKGVTDAINPERKNVIVFLSSNRSKVTSFVSLLNNYGKSMGLTLYGLQGWQEMDLEIELLKNLDYHEPSSTFIDYESAAVKQFVRHFRSVTNTEPLIEEHAFLGFDIGWYFLQALMNYGTDFGPCLENMNLKGLQFDFRFLKDQPVNGYSNSVLRIIKLQDYKWVEAK
jgi:LysM repeat protein/ABC-type branched-subunit amino acid transport system substrate-binding protein